MKIFTFFIFAVFFTGCAIHSSSECRTNSCITHKETEQFCRQMQAEGAFCLEYNFRDFCEIRGGNNQKIGTPCLDSLIYKEILEVFDGKWAKGTVGTVKPTKDSTGAGPYWVNDISYGYTSFTRDIVQGDEVYHHYCKSKDNKNCDMIFLIHTDGGPMYRYDYETKEINAAGWPM